MIDGITIEVCIENGTRIDELIARKNPDGSLMVDRVELNDNLAAGGITASYGVAKKVIGRCHDAGIKVMSMVRPRGGGFVYSDDEFSAMTRDLRMMRELESDGVVFGCLSAAGLVDREKTARLIAAADGMATVFHMAFDSIGITADLPAAGGAAEEARLAALRLESIGWLAGAGITRVLTGGALCYGPVPPDALANSKRIKAYAEAAGGRIGILAGGGITADNFRALCALAGLKEVHGSRLP